jgi:hypothetical protein
MINKLLVRNKNKLDARRQSIERYQQESKENSPYKRCAEAPLVYQPC